MDTVAAWTGQECVTLRDALRWSQSELAAHIGVSTRTVKRWESGERVGRKAAADLDTTLAQAPAEAAQRFHQLRGEDRVDRRQLLRAAPVAAGLATLGLQPGALFPGGPGRPDAAAVQVIRQTLHSAMQLDDMLGSPAAQGMVVAQTSVTEAMLRDCTALIRPAVLSLHAEWMGFAGCLAWDSGEYDAAARLYTQARNLAHDAEDSDLGAYMLTHLAQLAIWQQRPRVAMDYAVAAQSWVRDSEDKPLRAYVHMRTAEAAAIAGRKHDCLAALAAAEVEMEGVQPAHPSSSRAYFVGPGMLESYKGGCLTLVGEPGAAVDASQRALTMMDAAYTRDRAITLLELERGLIKLGQIDEAAAAVGEAAELTAQNRSPRLVGAIRAGRAHLSPWAGSRSVQGLDAQLSDRDILAV
ncbi:helix-turn-helix domain-containing protein [Nocardia cyriacigeorgica]|uniref:helix-turn-helix domain-containing protein n=3 Tax=Nocardia cyriacigeorgica TaxID=135487 RepID=UPI001895F854|nr:helix-turn-helix domain-containing protein [Nocardia cyriacigeorgica]MBF6451875.1 helix-turn-helix domain-containing protein [Nocardia cyriacigeorgica]MBF6549044.1 helix-turn-helix domain-containing protein [Nocardia cyriacigeorgica]